MTEAASRSDLGRREEAFSTTGTALAVDVGGTLLKGGVVAGDRSLSFAVTTPTFAVGAEGTLLERVSLLVRALLNDLRGRGLPEPVAIGIAAPGLVDEREGVIHAAYNLGWREVDVVSPLEAEFGLSVVLRQDARAAALVEQRVGAASGASDFIFVALGTGIGAAVVLDGAPRPGAHSQAGEIGHIVVAPTGEECACGAHGCLETVASARAIARRYLTRSRSSGVDIDAAAVIRLAGEGDEVAAEVWRAAIAGLAGVLCDVQKLIDVELIVLGGGLAMAGDALLVPLAEAMAATCGIASLPRLRVSSIGQQAGLLGAGIAALDAHDAEQA
jgi:glucokinase